MRYKSYQEFNNSYGFEAKAGFALTPKQVEAVEISLEWGKVLNTLEVGCGKTVISTAVSLILDNDLTIVTCVPILVEPWVEWLRSVDDRLVLEYQGTKREREQLRENFYKARWIVCSFAIYRKEFKFLLQCARTLVDNTNGPAKKRYKTYDLIVDEAHWAKNPESVLYTRIKTMSAGQTPVQLLTGTPINKPLDSYSYINITQPKVYDSYNQFERLHVKSYDFFDNPKEYQNLDVLSERFSARRLVGTKEEYHGFKLKPLFPNGAYNLSPAHLKLYYQLVDDQLLELPDGSLIDASTTARLRHALQQIIVNFDFFSGDPKARSTCFDLIDQTVDETNVREVEHSKLIIWTKYKRSSARVLKYVTETLGIEAVAAYSEANSKESVRLFMKEPKVRVMVAQVQSVGAGLNPQYVCSENLFLEYDAIPMYMRQALGRTLRVGQTKVPRMKFAIALNTVQVGHYNDLRKKDSELKTFEPEKATLEDMLKGRETLTVGEIPLSDTDLQDFATSD